MFEHIKEAMAIFRNWNKPVPLSDQEKAGLSWMEKQSACANSGTRYYGDGGTIHGDRYLGVEVCNGHVEAVWFRCQHLPFREYEVSSMRRVELDIVYGDGNVPELCGVEVKDK